MSCMRMSRRGLFRTVLAALGAYGVTYRAPGLAAELKVPEGAREEKFDFETKGIEGWTPVNGQWAVEEMPGAPSGKKVLVQRATRNEFNVIVAPPGPFTDVDISMKFDPFATAPSNAPTP